MTTPSATPLAPRRRLWLRAGGWALAAVVLAAVFMLYTQPEFMVRMADHVWACF
ncbi:hypothetical protein [Comamonas sp. 4034]|uniref:hypothetical protein n=1 Tax=Comamonas sp. 4034 TaxID=3156455 RepID=UPI00320BF429